MSKAGSRADHDKFCRTEGWKEVRNARGKKVGHHLTYELDLPDGRILRTRVSRPANTEAYGPSLWNTILDDQLCVTEEQFWSCVDRGVAPPRGDIDVEAPKTALPAQLVYQLITVAKVPEEQIAQLTVEEAAALMAAHWSRPQND
jgi:hypothetical protein